MPPSVTNRLVLLAVSFFTSAVPLSAQPLTAEERTMSPYQLPQGARGMLERAQRAERLAAVAETEGDFARAARHLTTSCYARSELVLDVSLKAASCQRARKLGLEHNVVDVAIALLHVEGNMRAWSLDVTGAVEKLQAAIALGKNIDPDSPDAYPLNVSHFTLGAILIEAGQFDLAGRELSHARTHCGNAKDRMCVAFTYVWGCRLQTQLGELDTARRECDAALEQAGGDIFLLMNLGWMRANLENALGKPDAALATLLQTWKYAQVSGGELLLPTLMHFIADVLVTLNRLDEAEVWQQQLERAMVERRLPASYGPQTSLRRGQIEFARGRIDRAIEALAVASAGSPMHELAITSDYLLASAHRARGDLPSARKSLETAIARIEAGRTSVAGAALRASYLNLHARAYQELIATRWDVEGAAASSAILEIAEAGRARSLLDALASAQVAGAVAPTLRASEVQDRLTDDEVLIEYVAAEDRLFAVTVTRDRIKVTPLTRAGKSAALAERVHFFNALIQQGSDSDILPAARKLYDDLLKPALDGVSERATTLIIAADGALHRLPFDALGDTPRVLDRWNVVTLPSASALANRSPRGEPPAAALVVAASTSVAGLAPLAAAPGEAAAIRRRVAGEIAELSGAGATKDELQKQGLDRFAVLHFASHALVDESRPLRSALLLAASGAGNDGRWNAEEIYRAKLRADLVVLSACRTAAGATTAGEGVMSLARAFLYAGAGATVATLWDIPDAPGPLFADTLYRELVSGQSLGAAVAATRRELRRRGAPPRVWAAYVVTGNPSARVAVTARTNYLMTAGGVFVGAAALILVVRQLRRRR